MYVIRNSRYEYCYSVDTTYKIPRLKYIKRGDRFHKPRFFTEKEVNTMTLPKTCDVVEVEVNENDELVKLAIHRPPNTGAGYKKKTEYVVYDKTGVPLCIGNSDECAAYLEIKVGSFYECISRQNKHKHRKYEIYKIES